MVNVLKKPWPTTAATTIKCNKPEVRHGEWSRRDASDIDGQSREAE